MGLVKATLQPTACITETHPIDGSDLPMLLAGLNAHDSDLRRMTARDLSQFPAAVDALAAQLEVEKDHGVIESIMAALASIGTTESLSMLLPGLRSEDAFVRNETIELLKHMPEAVAPVMQDLLLDADPDVRIFAVNVLESLKHPKVVEWLIDVLEADAHVNVVATALDLIAEVGNESCIPALLEVQDRFHDEPYLQFAARTALGRIERNRGQSQ